MNLTWPVPKERPRHGKSRTIINEQKKCSKISALIASRHRQDPFVLCGSCLVFLYV